MLTWCLSPDRALASPPDRGIIVPAMDCTGQVIGEVYQVERLLGRGRFAAVYAARNTLVDRTVAIKVFRPELTSKAGGGRRFLRKSRVASDQPHPAIVPIEDRGMTHDGQAFVVMELLQGRTLEAQVKSGGPLPVSRCLRIASVVLEALATVHDEGFTHRNINPANVFLAEGRGEPVRILDYGVVQELVDYLAVSPEVMGSTSFLAPEFLLSPKKVWTPAIDVFATGMVCFYMLTGRLPFNKEDHDLGDSLDAKTIGLYHTVEALPGPATVSPHVPGPIDEVVRRALTVDPNNRYRDAEAMLEALREAEGQVPTGELDARPSSPSRSPAVPPFPSASPGAAGTAAPMRVPAQLGGGAGEARQRASRLDPLDVPTERMSPGQLPALHEMIKAAAAPETPIDPLNASTEMMTPDQIASLGLAGSHPKGSQPGETPGKGSPLIAPTVYLPDGGSGLSQPATEPLPQVSETMKGLSGPIDPCDPCAPTMYLPDDGADPSPDPLDAATLSLDRDSSRRPNPPAVVGPPLAEPTPAASRSPLKLIAVVVAVVAVLSLIGLGIWAVAG